MELVDDAKSREGNKSNFQTENLALKEVLMLTQILKCY